tara:strand:- start:113 stop:394 length:282 start_codon:yes stop_codon:yes gene_type:complete
MDKEKIKALKKAAERGYEMAQTQLGVMYQYGQGVKQNYEKAVSWYRKAAEQGYPQAQNQLGYIYFHGQGVAQDDVEADRWFKLAKVEWKNRSK